MCEPPILAKTGKTVEQHQGYTTGNYCRLRGRGGNFIPVLQGWTIADYFRHIDMYRSYGVDLDRMHLVGVGSICRRQGTREIDDLLAALKGAGLRLHAFGLKTNGLSAHRSVVSSDSMAWSYDARRKPPMEGCTAHINCANCEKFAMKWRDKLLSSLRARALSDWAALVG
jgi:hypothetical protein